jgi:hypothetical protein
LIKRDAKIVQYDSLVKVQVMAGVTVNDGVSSADTELSMYLEKACDTVRTNVIPILKGIKVKMYPAKIGCAHGWSKQHVA